MYVSSKTQGGTTQKTEETFTGDSLSGIENSSPFNYAANHSCGACGTVCSITNGVGVCSSGACRVASCNTGFGDCNALPTDGCETNTQTSSSNCGACGTVCAGGGACTAGSCAPRCNTGAARVLVYGPGGTAGTEMFPAGTVVTVASDAMWRSMTAAQFAQYDVIWIDGGNCGGGSGSNYGTAQDTVATWGPAVQGRIVLLTGDADYTGTATPRCSTATRSTG